MFHKDYESSLEKTNSKLKSPTQSLINEVWRAQRDRAKSQMPVRVAQLALLEEKPRNFREAYQKLLDDKKQKAAETKPAGWATKKNTDRTRVNNLEGKLFEKMKVLEQHKQLAAKFR